MGILSGSKSHGHAANQPLHSSHVASGKATNVTIKPKEKQKQNQKQDKGKAPEKNSLPAEGRPVQMSRTQKDKERKKRSKAAVLMDHVDIIKDDFWERRPWILSGRAGV
jgi:tRNA(His) guanylyltransferase